MARFLIALALAATVVTTGLIAATPAFAGDAKAGQSTFKANCAICHGDSAKSPPGIGPRLYGVIGRKSGSLLGYSYSSAMKSSGLTWSADVVQRYLVNPQATVRGNKMPFAGLKSEVDRENIAAYLSTLH